MTINDYALFFSQHYDRDRGLDYGRLSLNSLGNGVINIWKATSSVASKQYPESFHERGGIIPPPYRCKNLVDVSVSITQIKGSKFNTFINTIDAILPNVGHKELFLTV
ncbi:MAG: hypothetical protein QNJ18_06815 [Xenococcaceae cyanobacterium MO_167.B52]|nr:hypothetical protein [Xenococcaceae cyanobacterium MO_167.B52]